MRLKFGILIFQILLVFFVATPSSGSLIGDLKTRLKHRLERFEHFRSIIHKVFYDIGHNPKSTILHSLFPEATELISKEILQLEKCYNPTVRGKHVNIFKQPLGVVVHKYLELFGHYEQAMSEAEYIHQIIEGVRHLVRTIKIIAEIVIECVTKANDKDYEPTKIRLNKFAIWSPEAIDSMRMKKLGRGRGQKLDDEAQSFNDAFDVSDIEDNALPATFDYRKQGVISHIKDQGAAGTCFIFGPLAALEASYMLKTGKSNISFSEGDLLNCLVAKRRNTDPLNGGLPTQTLEEAAEHGVLLEAAAPPYLVKRYPISPQGNKPEIHPERCKDLDASKAVTRVKGWSVLSAESGGSAVSDPLMLKKILFKYGPVATRFKSPEQDPLKAKWNALNDVMKFSCNANDPPAHSMAIIGWDEKHFIFKNSYGNDPADMWGLDGYLYLPTKYLEPCGVIGPDSEIIFPTVV